MVQGRKGCLFWLAASFLFFFFDKTFMREGNRIIMLDCCSHSSKFSYLKVLSSPRSITLWGSQTHWETFWNHIRYMLGEYLSHLFSEISNYLQSNCTILGNRKYPNLLEKNFKLINFFNWRIIALQNFVVFCQTSIWISHRCPNCVLLTVNEQNTCPPAPGMLVVTIWFLLHRFQNIEMRTTKDWENSGY